MLRYLVERRRRSTTPERRAIPQEVIKDALIAYLTPFTPGPDIVDIEFKGMPDPLNITIYTKGEKSKTKKD